MSTNEEPLTTPEGESRDLGFGSVVARERKRLLNRDGTFNTRRANLRFFESHGLYHTLLTMSWTRFFCLLGGVFVLINSAFALLYFAAGPNALSDLGDVSTGMRLLDTFFFSVQTFGTIGYGAISPISVVANFIVTVESLVSLLVFALSTGLMFARFSRPLAKIKFSEKAVIAPYRGGRAFMLRIANVRSNELVEVEAKIVLGMFKTVAGSATRTFSQLELERTKVAFLPLSWTIVHPITPSSPLYELSEADYQELAIEFLVLLTAIDETFSQTVHARMSYTADEIIWNARFSDIFGRSEDAEMLTVDISRIDATEPG